MTETTPMTQIEQATQEFRKAYDLLEQRVDALEQEAQALKRRRLPGIKSAAQMVAERQSQLAALVERNPGLFEKPRTVTIAGIRVGIQKGKGKIVCDDPETTCRLIRKHFPDQADALIKVIEKPVLRSLGNMTTAELKRVGAAVTDTGDQIIIKPVDGDVDKLVNALLKEAEQWEQAA